MLPRCDTLKQILFTPRIIAFNESFVPAGTSKYHPVAVLGLSVPYFVFLKNIRDVEDIVIWLDNCSDRTKIDAYIHFLSTL